MFCKYCGALNDDNAVYCTKCSKQIGVPTVEPVVQATEPPIKAEAEASVQPENKPVEIKENDSSEKAGNDKQNKHDKRTKKNKRGKKESSAADKAPAENAEPTAVPLIKFKKALAVFSYILALLSFNFISNIFSVIAITRSAKYNTSVAAENNRAANKSAKAAKALSVISIIISLLTFAAAAVFVWWAMRYTNFGLLF